MHVYPSLSVLLIFIVHLYLSLYICIRLYARRNVYASLSISIYLFYILSCSTFFTFIHHFHLCSSLFAFIHLCSSLCVFIHLHSSQTSGFVFTHLYAKHLYSTFSHHPSSLVIDIYVQIFISSCFYVVWFTLIGFIMCHPTLFVFVEFHPSLSMHV